MKLVLTTIDCIIIGFIRMLYCHTLFCFYLNWEAFVKKLFTKFFRRLKWAKVKSCTKQPMLALLLLL